jgi:hypothetical protein
MRARATRGLLAFSSVFGAVLFVQCSSDSAGSGARDGGGDTSPGPDTGCPGCADAAREAGTDDATTTDAGADSTTSPEAGGHDTGTDAATDAGDSGTRIACLADAGADAGLDAGGCPPSLTCCNGFCADTARDPANCGACGVACTSAQFCTRTACKDTVFKNLCASPNASVTRDNLTIDDDAGIVLVNALEACSPVVTVRLVSQGAAGILGPGGQQITGPGDMLTIPGGSFGQQAAAYLDTNGITPVFGRQGAGNNWEFVERKSGTAVVTVDTTALGAGHDLFVLELAVEPTNGTLSMLAYGLNAPGTTAAAFWLSASVVPNRGAFTARWYIYEWIDATDGGGTPGAPDLSDTFTVRASGM